MTDSKAKRLATLHSQYEDALEAHRSDPEDGEAHARSVELAEKLATARQDDRVDQVKRGVRSPGVGITAEGGE
jgi:hypothetical protein